jgi:hypothetical protein
MGDVIIAAYPQLPAVHPLGDAVAAPKQFDVRAAVQPPMGADEQGDRICPHLRPDDAGPNPVCHLLDVP